MLIGHTMQRDRLARLLKDGRLPHSLLFSGPGGIGKATTANFLANRMFCSADLSTTADLTSCGQCTQCKLIRANNFPDLHCRDANDLTVEDLRQLLQVLSLKAFSSSHKVVILDNSDEMSLQCANILLKSLEEPRADTYFILISANANKLPITVRSRCQTLFFQGLEDTELEMVMEQVSGRSLNAKERNMLTLADGSVAGLDRIEKLSELFDSIASSLAVISHGSTAEALALAKDLGRLKDQSADIFHVIKSVLRQGVQAGNGRMATVLMETMRAEEAHSSRHLNLTYLLELLFLELAAGPDVLEEQVLSQIL